MKATIAIIGAGAMGSTVAQRLIAHDVRVLTLLNGRSARTAARARDAGMIAAPVSDIAAADFIFSILPPAEAVGAAASLAPVLRSASSKSVFVDFNAINPKTMQQVTAVLAETGCEVLDGAIIGLPPTPGSSGPTFYVSGDPHYRTDILHGFGLKLRRIDSPAGAASALKMVYAGINKGLTALGTAMLLAAARAGCAEELRRELTESLPHILTGFTRSIPDMYPKAYRWVAEMKEIERFLGLDDPAASMFDAAANIFEQVAEDRSVGGEMATILNHSLGLD